MDKATKAALFNALLFPGWGHFYLKRYIRGLIFLIPVLLGSLALTWMVIRIGAAMIKAAPFKKGTVHLKDVFQVILNSIKTIDLSNLYLVLLIIVILWILSVFDAYFLGKKEL